MRSLLNRLQFRDAIEEHATDLIASRPWQRGQIDTTGWSSRMTDGGRAWAPRWPLPNVWLGVSLEAQQRAELRIPALLDTPAALRWVSAEPLLGPINMSRWLEREGGRPRLDWVVAGGESGSGARPLHPDWVRSIGEQCTAAGVPWLFKQWGDWLPTPVFDAPGFAGGRAFDHPDRGTSSTTLRRRGPSGRYRNGETRCLEPGDRTRWYAMLDRDTIAVRVGKKAAGRELDGV